MLYPSTKELMEKVDSRYTLVVAVAKRARQLIDGSEPRVEPKSHKPVSIATQEIVENVVFPVITSDEKNKEMTS
ncbi:MAG: DNA-directed RNA polymerase subunit omega [Clostridiales bacterium]|nr:DNA-directed RNA polymerase subunit omega [Clostridiales bacterium]